MIQHYQATYDSDRTIESVMFDLLGTGVPHGNIEYDRENHRLDVTIPEGRKLTVLKILKRHHPRQLN